jgi:hypothetical protein
VERWLRTPTRHTLLLQMVPRYHEAPASQKGVLLDEAVTQTGYTRGYGYCHGKWWIIRRAPVSALRADFLLIRLSR